MHLISSAKRSSPRAFVDSVIVGRVLHIRRAHVPARGRIDAPDQ